MFVMMWSPAHLMRSWFQFRLSNAAVRREVRSTIYSTLLGMFHQQQLGYFQLMWNFLKNGVVAVNRHKVNEWLWVFFFMFSSKVFQYFNLEDCYLSSCSRLHLTISYCLSHHDQQSVDLHKNQSAEEPRIYHLVHILIMCLKMRWNTYSSIVGPHSCLMWVHPQTARNTIFCIAMTTMLKKLSF